MHKLKKLRIKHQETKRRIQFTMHMSNARDRVFGVQTVIPEVERHHFEEMPDLEGYSQGTST